MCYSEIVQRNIRMGLLFFLQRVDLDLDDYRWPQNRPSHSFTKCCLSVFLSFFLSIFLSVCLSSISYFYDIPLFLLIHTFQYLTHSCLASPLFYSCSTSFFVLFLLLFLLCSFASILLYYSF